MRNWVLLVIFGAFLAAIEAAALYGGDDTLALVIAAVAVLVGALNAEIQRAFALQQQRLAERQTELTERQADLGETMRFLTAAPVLAARFPSGYGGHGIEVDNAGNGPAMDVRAFLWPESDADEPLPLHPLDRHHQGINDDVLKVAAKERQTRGGVNYQETDVWILHCGDLNGQHWHAWSNWSRKTKDDPEGKHVPTGLFVFENENMTPRWIRQHCPRCVGLEKEGLKRPVVDEESTSESHS